METQDIKTQLESYFKSGAQPTEAQFKELIHAYIVNGEKVGIATDSPANTLDVNGKMVVGGSYAASQNAPTNGLLVQGNTGLGHAIADEPLHVKGNVRIDDGGLMIGSTPVIDSNGDWVGGSQGNDETGSLLWTDSAGKVTTNASVGIKETSPQAPLHVKGDVRIDNGGLRIGADEVIDSDGNWLGNPIQIEGGTSQWIEGEGTIQTNAAVGINNNLTVGQYVNKQQVAFTANGFAGIDGQNKKVMFTGEVGAASSHWDTAGHAFVAPVDGLYCFMVSLTIDDVDGTCVLAKSDGNSPLITVREPNDGRHSSISLITPLTQNETVSLFVNNDKMQIIQVNMAGYRL